MSQQAFLKLFERIEGPTNYLINGTNQKRQTIVPKVAKTNEQDRHGTQNPCTMGMRRTDNPSTSARKRREDSM